MPGRDGTGPIGGGQGSRSGIGRGGTGQGRMSGNRPGAGPSGNCVCPDCGTTLQHQAGTPCYNLNCPKCGKKMVRA